ISALRAHFSGVCCNRLPEAGAHRLAGGAALGGQAVGWVHVFAFGSALRVEGWPRFAERGGLQHWRRGEGARAGVRGGGTPATGGAGARRTSSIPPTNGIAKRRDRLGAKAARPAASA